MYYPQETTLMLVQTGRINYQKLVPTRISRVFCKVHGTCFAVPLDHTGTLVIFCCTLVDTYLPWSVLTLVLISRVVIHSVTALRYKL